LTWKSQNLSVSKQSLDRKKSKGNVVIVKCTRCGKYQFYKPRAKNVKRRRKVCVFCGSRFEVNGRSVIKVGLAAREARLLIAKLNSKGRDIDQILTSLRGQNKDHKRTINDGTIRTIGDSIVNIASHGKGDEKEIDNLCHSQSDKKRTIYKAQSMACDVIDKCKVEYYDSDRVRTTLYFPREFWEELKNFKEEYGYSSMCFLVFVASKVYMDSLSGGLELGVTAKGRVFQVIKEVRNDIDIFYNVKRARRDVSFKVLKDLKERLDELSRRLERVEEHLKDNQEYLNALPTLISLLERHVSILERSLGIAQDVEGGSYVV